MDNQDKVSGTEETGNLNRNRSFKSKLLVRSQAIRESQSPPRTSSPTTEMPVIDNITVHDKITINDKTTANDNGDIVTDTSSQSGDNCVDANSLSDSKSSFSDEFKKQTVEIQITSGAWDEQSDQRQRTKRWLGPRPHSDSSRDLLSNNPRVACVCGGCSACVHCRGRRRKDLCPTKQDSGIVCSDDCPDCSDSEQSGIQNDDGRSSTVEDEQSYCRCPDRKEIKTKTISLCRNDSAEEKAEPSGAELVAFIKHTLNKNARDRMTLLKIEKELRALVNDNGRCIVRFPVMTSYGRMLVHRCAALFQLSHHLDQSNKTCVLVSKSGTSGGRIPCTDFRKWCTTPFPPSPQRFSHQDTLTKSILKRDSNSLDEPGSGSLANSRSKSLEQREKEYERVRRRIFSEDNCSQDESQCLWASSGPVKVLTAEPGRNKLLKVQSLESSSGPQQSWRGRGAVAKSHSFGGYGGSQVQCPATTRVLSKQGDVACSSWRLSPSSSGYKTLSTESVCSPTGGVSPEPAAPVAPGVVWCVTDLCSVPPGAVLIHPQTGRPLTNSDGSIYHFDPANPPVLYDNNNCGQIEQDKLDCNEKRRGRLEKQHSFIDTDCEYQNTEECRGKCCCECRRRDCCQKTNVEKTNQQQQQEQKSKPPTPVENRYENTTNHNAEINARTYETTNQKPPENPRQYETKRFENSNFEQPYERTFEKSQRQFEATNQRTFEPTNQMANDVANQRAVANTLTNQDNQELQYATVNQYSSLRNDEVTSPPQVSQYQNEQTNIQAMAQAKMTPVPMPDPNIRPMSLTNVMYPTITPGYPYVNQCRMDPMQPMYQPIMQEEQKQMPHAGEPTFRIDPSWSCAQTGACGACVPALHTRGYNVPYGQMEMPTVLPPYPVGNMVLPQPAVQHYPYGDLQWTNNVMPLCGPKMLVPEMYPCPQYNMYPQHMPRATWPSSAAETPVPEAQVPEEKNLTRQNSNEIAVKIQQIKEQMSQLNTRDRREEWRTGTGILGSCPAPTERRPANDETQLTSAARAIVNTIRSMQAKSLSQDRRPEQYRPERRRPDDRNKPDERPYLLRQISPGTWCRRSPAPVHPVFNQPRRPHPDNRNQRR